MSYARAYWRKACKRKTGGDVACLKNSASCHFMYVCVCVPELFCLHISHRALCVCACLGCQQIAMRYESQSASCAPDVPKVFFKCWRRWWWGWCGVGWWTSLRGWDLLNPSRFGLLLFFFLPYASRNGCHPRCCPSSQALLRTMTEQPRHRLPPAWPKRKGKHCCGLVWMEYSNEKLT